GLLVPGSPQENSRFARTGNRARKYLTRKGLSTIARVIFAPESDFLPGFSRETAKAQSADPYRSTAGGTPSSTKPTASKCASRDWIYCGKVWVSPKRHSNGLAG